MGVADVCMSLIGASNPPPGKRDPAMVTRLTVTVQLVSSCGSERNHSLL